MSGYSEDAVAAVGTRLRAILEPAEADQLGADGIVGVRLRVEFREFGSDIRFPFAPPERRSEPMLIAMPTQMVCTSGLMNCIVS